MSENRFLDIVKLEVAQSAVPAMRGFNKERHGLPGRHYWDKVALWTV